MNRDRERPEKGKGKEKAEDQPAAETGSFLSRAAGSAVGLGASLFAGPRGSGDVPDIGPSEKGRPSVPAPTPSSGDTSSVYRSSEPGPVAGFRRQQHIGHDPEPEKDFSRFLCHSGAYADSGVRGASPDEYASGGTFSAITAQEQRDGADVVNLLSRMNDGFPDQIAGSDMPDEELAGLRRALFETGETRTTEWNNVLNFIPDFVRPDASGVYGEEGSWKAAETRSTLGLSPSPETTRVWVEQWTDVLTRYNDEVWGDLRPLVREAREELKNLSEGGQDGRRATTTALQRLRQVLGHIRYG